MSFLHNRRRNLSSTDKIEWKWFNPIHLTDEATITQIIMSPTLQSSFDGEHWDKAFL